MDDEQDKKNLKKCFKDMIEAIHETIEQLRPTEQQLQASTIDIHSFTLDKSEDTAIDLLKVKLMEMLNNYVRRLSGICRNYLFKFLQQYDYDENMRNFTSSFNMDTLDPFARDLEAALASIDAFAAAYKGSKDPVLEFLNKYPTLKDKPGLYGTTLLYSAARNNHEVLVRYLIESAQCAINAQNQQQLEDVLQTHVESTYKQINPSSGSTALHGACYNGHLKIVQYLIKRGADYFIRNQIQETPIMNGQRHGNIREFFEKFLILGYSTTAKTLPEKPISERPENNTFDCIWEYKSVSNPQWSQFSDDESKELSEALIISPDEEMQRTIYLGVPPNTFSVSIVDFVRSGINRDPNNQRAWVRCRGSSIFNYDCYARWQIMLLKHTGIQTASPASWNITDIPAVYDSKFQVQLNCWYNCTNKINARLDDAINYRRKQMNMELQFLKDDFDFDLQEFTLQNSDKTVSGCIRWIPKLIANDERYRNKIHEIDNYQNLSHVQPIPLTTKRLREVSKMSPTKPSTKLDDDFKEEDENDEDLTPRTFLNGNVDEDSLDETNKEYIELFNIYIEDKKKLLIDQCILGDLTTIKAELEKQTDSFIKDKPLITEIEPLKYQTLEKFIEQNITHQRNHYEKKPSPKAVSVLDTFIKQLKEDFKTNQKFTGLHAKHFALDLLDKVNQNTVTTISTSTGSGKSTLLPALLAAEGYDKIIVTQPRRLPCTLICQRVNETMTSVKDPFSEKLAGWAVSGAERNPRAKILYVTDGLLKERLLYDENFITHNTQLNKSIIFFIDEVHERSVNIDHCLALLARMLSINPALKSKMKIIISSATLDSSVPDLFRKIKQVSLTEFVMPQMGTIHPITKYSRKNENILNIVQELYQKRRRHDQILCFVSSVKDVNECCSLLKTITGGVIIAYPLIQSQQASTQKEYIENGSVFFSTTVAETSLTFPQLRYVIDTGMINIPVYDPESKRTVLQEDRAAESTIKQRLGRLGRTQPGEYYSLYDFEVEEKKYPTPQICQSDLTNIEFALRKSPLKQGLHHMKQFFPDSPPNKTIDQTVKTLRLLGILKAAPSEDFTKHGEALAKLPDYDSLAMSKSILSALQDNSCGRDLIYLSSILSVLNTSALLKSIPEHLKSSDGDFMTLFNVMREILLVKQSVPDNQFNLQYVCQVKGLSAIHHILRQALRRYVSLERSFNSLVEYRAQSQITSGDWPSIAKSLLAGYYENVFVSLKEIYGRNHHYVRYDSTNENIAVLDSQSTLARHRSMSPVPLVLARDIRYASSIRSRAVLSFLGELQPEWIEYQVQRNIVLNEKEAAYLTNKYILPTAKTNFHSIDIQLISDTLSIEGKAGTSLKAELYIRQQLTVEQPEFELENRFDPDTEEYKNLSRNLESVMKMPHIFKPMIWRWEAERQAKITVNPNTSTKNITVKVVARDSDYENIKKEFKSFVRWLGYCAVMRRPNSGVPPRVFRPQVRAQYHDIEERISHITDTKRTLIDLYKSVKGQNATRETRMEVFAWIAVCHGAYFADDPAKSHQYTVTDLNDDTRVIYYTKVVLGNVSHQSAPSTELVSAPLPYHSVVGKLNGFTEYIVYRYGQALPYLKITYTA
ncbi:unnamed protein product [Rotaria sp. Silwood1]|nr:unnamed protein product [Rotaria sp. Silwood1]